MAGMLVLEAGVRFLRPQPLSAVGRSARLGWVHKPNTEIVYEREEFRIPVRFSNAGLRDRDYPFSKPAGTRRIAVLGDSFVEALQVPFDSTFVERLEGELDRRADGAWRSEVLNFGVSGYGTCQQLLLLEDLALRFDPDLVLSCFYANDHDDDARVRLCDLDASGNLVVTSAQRLPRRERMKSGIKSFLYQHSHLWMFLRGRTLRFDPGPRRAPAPGPGTADAGAGSAVAACPGRHPTLEWRSTLCQTPADAQAAVARHVAVWRRMQELCHARGIRFIAVLGVSKWQIEPELYARTLQDLGCVEAAHDVDATSQRLTAAAAAAGIEVLDLLPAFRRGRQRERLHFRIDGHWNAAGHRVAARQLVEALAGRAMLDPVQP